MPQPPATERALPPFRDPVSCPCTQSDAREREPDHRSPSNHSIITLLNVHALPDHRLSIIFHRMPGFATCTRARCRQCSSCRACGRIVPRETRRTLAQRCRRDSGRDRAPCTICIRHKNKAKWGRKCVHRHGTHGCSFGLQQKKTVRADSETVRFATLFTALTIWRPQSRFGYFVFAVPQLNRSTNRTM